MGDFTISTTEATLAADVGKIQVEEKAVLDLMADIERMDWTPCSKRWRRR